jgi:sugar lactone lactonase YvrE
VGTAAHFNYPRGITTDGKNLFVADGDNHLIRKIDPSTGVVSTFAGDNVSDPPVPGYSDGIGTAARFAWPSAITTDGVNLFVADTDNHLIRKIVIATSAVTTLAGCRFSD